MILAAIIIGSKYHQNIARTFAAMATCQCSTVNFRIIQWRACGGTLRQLHVTLWDKMRRENVFARSLRMCGCCVIAAPSLCPNLSSAAEKASQLELPNPFGIYCGLYLLIYYILLT
jgi:hypothetical protein